MGRAMCRPTSSARVQKPPSSPTVNMPDTGKTGNTHAKAMSSRMPSQNTGMDQPMRVTTVTAWLNGPYSLREASVPSSVPATTERTSDENTSRTVGPTRPRMRSRTGWLKK